VAESVASPPGQLDEVTFGVGGMTCAACQARVQRVLERHPGVSGATVNLMMANAAVRFDPASATIDDLLAAVRGTGYSATPPATERNALAEQDEQDQAQREEFRLLKRKAIVAACRSCTRSRPPSSRGGCSP
jgi:Cu+-exporting ATPase